MTSLLTGTPRWAGPAHRFTGLGACLAFMLVWQTVLVVVSYAMPTLRPAALPTLGAALVNAIVFLFSLAVVLALGWGRGTGAYQAVAAVAALAYAAWLLRPVTDVRPPHRRGRAADLRGARARRPRPPTSAGLTV